MSIRDSRNLSAPLIWCWDNLNGHLAPQLAEFAAENKRGCGRSGLRRTPELNPTEGIWSMLSSPWPTSPPQTLTAWSASSSAS